MTFDIYARHQTLKTITTLTSLEPHSNTLLSTLSFESTQLCWRNSVFGLAPPSTFWLLYFDFWLSDYRNKIIFVIFMFIWRNLRSWIVNILTNSRYRKWNMTKSFVSYVVCKLEKWDWYVHHVVALFETFLKIFVKRTNLLHETNYC